MEIRRAIYFEVQFVIKELWEHLRDDMPLRPEDFEPRYDEDSLWYASYEDDELVGVYWVHRLNHVMWEAHTNVRKKFWGTGLSVPHAEAVLEQMFKDTGAEKIIAHIPEYDKQIVGFVEKLGFTQEGQLTKAWQKDGVLYDLIVMAKQKVT